MRFPFERVFKKRGIRRFIMPFGVALAVVFVGLITAAA